MMGSHFDYAMRYPKEFAHFSEKDYASQPQDHRATLAAYDNSILYNDYVVAQIINLFKDRDAVVIYLPDHGQVIYRDPKSPNYFSHGKKKYLYSSTHLLSTKNGIPKLCNESVTAKANVNDGIVTTCPTSFWT